MLRAPTRAEKLAEELAEAILTGDIPAGTRLDEHSLAQRFGVSRTPVREALKRLGGSSLVEVRPRRGAVVAGVHNLHMEEFFEALAEAEAVCARLAAIKMSAVERTRLDEFHLRCTEASMRVDKAAVPLTNRDLHEAIYAGAHNTFLADTVLNLRRKLAPFTRAQFGLSQRPSASTREHSAVMTAIRARDGAGAEDAMRRHIRSVGRAWSQWASETSLELTAPKPFA
jgi:DNA-binding GntR family transcriptional regulator